MPYMLAHHVSAGHLSYVGIKRVVCFLARSDIRQYSNVLVLYLFCFCIFLSLFIIVFLCFKFTGKFEQ